MQIKRSTADTAAGPSDWFTGSVYIDSVATPSGASRLSASSVHFTPAARTAWHTHPNGQTIYVTEGVVGDPSLRTVGVHRRADDDEAVDAERRELEQPSDAVLGRTQDPEPGGELRRQSLRLGRSRARVLVHVVPAVELAQHTLGLA